APTRGTPGARLPLRRRAARSARPDTPGVRALVRGRYATRGRLPAPPTRARTRSTTASASAAARAAARDAHRRRCARPRRRAKTAPASPCPRREQASEPLVRAVYADAQRARRRVGPRRSDLHWQPRDVEQLDRLALAVRQPREGFTHLRPRRT